MQLNQDDVRDSPRRARRKMSKKTLGDFASNRLQSRLPLNWRKRSERTLD
jgi:hypothetical protein